MPVRLAYRVATVRSEEDGHSGNELVEQGPQAKAWLSAKYCIYPQHVVFALQDRTVVEKIQVMGHPWATPTTIELWLGDVPKGQEVDVSKAMFFKLGEVKPESNKENDYTARQLQSVEITQAARPCSVTFVKLVLHKNYQNRKNQYNQVGLYGVNLIGSGATSSPSDWVEGDVLSPYDDLSFLMYTDQEVAQVIAKLEKKKQEAVATERFEYAKKIKSAIGELVEAGQMLGSLEIEKRLLAERQMYDEAKEKKTQMEDFRVEVYKNLEITDLLEPQGLIRSNDRPWLSLGSRLAPLLPPIQHHRLMLDLRLRPPPAPSQPTKHPPHPTDPTPQTKPTQPTEPRRAKKANLPTSPPPRIVAHAPSPPPSPLPPPPRASPPTSPNKSSMDVSDKDRNKLTIAIPVLGERLCGEVLSRKNKSAGLQELKDRITGYSSEDSTKPGKFYKAASQLLMFLLRDPVWATFKAGCEMVVLLYSTVVEPHPVSSKTLAEVTKDLFSVILSRSGESVERVHDLAILTGMDIVKSRKVEELSVLEELLTEKVTSKEPAKVALSRVKFTKFIISEYGLSEDEFDPMSVHNLTEYGSEAMRHPDPEVRAAGQQLVLLLYRADPGEVRRLLHEDKRTRNLFQQMDEIDKRKSSQR